MTFAFLFPVNRVGGARRANRMGMVVRTRLPGLRREPCPQSPGLLQEQL